MQNCGCGAQGGSRVAVAARGYTTAFTCMMGISVSEYYKQFVADNSPYCQSVFFHEKGE